MSGGRHLVSQQPDGDWHAIFSCLLGNNFSTLVRLGVQDDDRLKHGIELLIQTRREDGGFLRDMHKVKYKPRSVKSCIGGSAKALLARSELPFYGTIQDANN